MEKEVKNVLKFYIAYALSVFGFEFVMFIMTVYVYKMTNEPLNVGIFTAITLFPRFFSPYYGAIIDRYPKNISLCITSAITGLLVFILVHLNNIIHIYILWFIASVFIMFIKNVRIIIMTELKKNDYIGGNSIVLIASNTAKVTAPLVGGVIASFDPTFMLYVVSFFYLASSFFSFVINLKKRDQSEVQISVLAPVREGLTYLFSNRKLRYLLTLIVCWRMFLGFQTSIFVVYVITYLQAGNTEFGIFMSALGVGSIIGSFLGPRFFRNEKNFAYIPYILGAHYLTILLLGLINNFYLSVAIIFISYTFFYASLVGNHSLRDKATVLEIRGRTYGSVFAITTPVGVLSMLIGSYLTGLFGAQNMFLIGGSLAIISLILTVYKFTSKRNDKDDKKILLSRKV